MNGFVANDLWSGEIFLAIWSTIRRSNDRPSGELTHAILWSSPSASLHRTIVWTVIYLISRFFF